MVVERLFESEFTLFQNSSFLFHDVQFVKMLPAFLNSKGLYLRACLHGGGCPREGEAALSGRVKKQPAFTCNLKTPPFRVALSQDRNGR